MSTCRDFISEITDYVGGELPRDRCDVFEFHRDECSPCADYLKSYRETIRCCEAALDAPECAPGSEDCPDRLAESILDACRKKKPD